jgi:dolichyl-phosphate beta-glucosyltransferase
MGALQKTAIIIPCYNEYNRLRREQFVAYAHIHEDVTFIFVNDGSSDRTQEIIDDLCRSNPQNMACISLEENRGKAEAVRRGVIKARETNHRYIGYWDADLATPLDSIPRFVEILDRLPSIGIVMGSRVRLLGRRIDRKPARHYLGRIFSTATSLILRLPVYDTQCGSKLFRNSDELSHVFSSPFRTTWIFDVEILARFTILARSGRIPPLTEFAVEHPLDEWTDVSGSKLKTGDFIIACFDLIKIWIFLYVSNRPSGQPPAGIG